MAETDALAGLTATSFHRGNVAEDAATDTAGQVFVLDLQESLPGVLRLRDWAMAALAPQPGETALDVGSGTGAEVRRRAALPAQLVRAGLTVDPDVAATAVIPPVGAMLVLVQRTADEAVAAGVVTQAEADALLTDVRAAQDGGEAFMAVTMFAVLGRR